MFKLHNINDGEDIYQRCLLITGQCEESNQQDTFVQVNTTNESGIETFPSHRWPLCGGWFKCLVLLTPGKNIVKLSTGDGEHTTEASLGPSRYTPTTLNSDMETVAPPLLYSAHKHSSSSPRYHGSERFSSPGRLPPKQVWIRFFRTLRFERHGSQDANGRMHVAGSNS